MKIVPFEMKHLRHIDIRKWDRALVASVDPRPMIAAGPAFTLLTEEKVMGMGGVALLWDGVGEAWIISSPLFHKYPLAVTKAVHKMLGLIEKGRKLHRVQAAVLEDHPSGHKWIKSLGFVSEGKMTAYGPKRENFIRYARVK